MNVRGGRKAARGGKRVQTGTGSDSTRCGLPLSKSRSLAVKSSSPVSPPHLNPSMSRLLGTHPARRVNLLLSPRPHHHQTSSTKHPSADLACSTTRLRWRRGRLKAQARLHCRSTRRTIQRLKNLPLRAAPHRPCLVHIVMLASFRGS